MLRVVVLLEGEPSPQSEVLSTLEQVFIKDLCTLLPFIFFAILTSLPVPAAERQHHSMMLQHRDGARFPPDVMLGIQAKELNQTRESCFSWTEAFHCLLANFKRAVMYL
jgi:hypothetical protein